jgi:hypothetical protein
MYWRCGSELEHLLCKCEALSSNPTPKPLDLKKTKQKTNLRPNMSAVGLVQVMM